MKGNGSMYDEYKARYEKEFWIRKIKRLIFQINKLMPAGEEIDQKEVIKECIIRNEDYVIGVYFKYQKQYRNQVKVLINEEKRKCQ